MKGVFPYIFSVVIGVLVYLLVTMNKEEMVFIETQKVYDEFSMKVELEAEYRGLILSKKKILDSLEVALQIAYQSINSDNSITKEEKNEFEYKRAGFLKRKEQFKEQERKLLEEYTGRIWTQLNQYFKTFGEERHYSIVFGANGDGNVITGKEHKNITTELIEYVNNKYAGK